MYSICLSLTQHNAFKTVTNGVCCLFLFLLPVLCLHCGVWALATCSKWGLLSSCSTCASRCSGVSYGGHGLQGAWASVVAAHSLSSCGIWTLECGLQQWWPMGAVAVARRLSCLATCGIVWTGESNLCSCIGRQILNHWTTKDVLFHIVFHSGYASLHSHLEYTRIPFLHIFTNTYLLFF